MSDTVLTALIAAGAALFGAFLHPLADALNGKRAMRQRLWDDRHSCYARLLETYFVYANEVLSQECPEDGSISQKELGLYNAVLNALFSALLICEPPTQEALKDFGNQIAILLKNREAPPENSAVFNKALELMRKELKCQ